MLKKIRTYGEGPMAKVSNKGERVDLTALPKYGTVKTDISTDKGKYSIASWGKNNKLPNEMISLALSNGDVTNLLDTRKDFLYGTGIGVFECDADGNVKQLFSKAIRKTLLDFEINAFVKKCISSIVDSGEAPVNLSKILGKLKFKASDPITVRAVALGENDTEIKTYLVCADWDKPAKAVPVPAFNPEDPLKYPESIYILREEQTGMYYYPFPRWWASSEWIELANRIAKFYNDALNTEGNLGHVVRISQKAIDDLADKGIRKPDGNGGLLDEVYTAEEIADDFVKQADKLLYGTGKQKRVIDFCDSDKDGKMMPSIEFVPIPKTITGKEFSEIIKFCINNFCNSSGILGGLSGVSDNQMNSGGGTEITQGAMYQQFYRTNRERQIITSFLNKYFLDDFKAAAGIDANADVFFDFGNIMLQTLDKNPTGMQKAINTGG